MTERIEENKMLVVGRLPLAVLELRTNNEACDKMAVALDVVRQN
jgi:hypothetical protein